MSLETLKRNRVDISNLVKAAEQISGSTNDQKKNFSDERFWKPTVDKAGNGYAVIRFLPAAEGEELPWVRYWDHGFKGPTGLWYIEKSLTSIGKPDPLGEANARLWNSGIESDKEVVRERKRRLHYVTNILIQQDPSNPENEGKVFLYQFGKKIFDKITDVMQPQFADEDPINPFDLWEGADFKLKIRQVEGYRNYDKSEFATPKALSDDDAKLESIYGKVSPLSEFTDPSNYKTYDELKAKLMKVLGEEVVGAPTMKQEAQMNTPVEAKQPVTAEEVNNNDEDTMSYFAKLANDD